MESMKRGCSRNGVTPEWLLVRPNRQIHRPSNHNSLNEHLPQVWRHIRKGQKDGRYLVVHATLADKRKEVFISPLGVVTKSGTGQPDIRLINDYSFPENEAVNDYTDRSHLPQIKYNPPRDIARRICALRRDNPYARILLMAMWQELFGTCPLTPVMPTCLPSSLSSTCRVVLGGVPHPLGNMFPKRTVSHRCRAKDSFGVMITPASILTLGYNVLWTILLYE
ncbi:LOW QUALITY PROTEIN: hypothetical protein PHMEG_00028306 [Phytophthora megakarya]|uniref:Uncharacterized protein n=1 Tax=Phytophthora megakarya TaxID=4795 RepID=A0A225V5A9_9STRA|nr:LOW QUALITY PROTEIN: hypothetical protein PHMEG_00028306 [Phytophthora megakarya]